MLHFRLLPLLPFALLFTFSTSLLAEPVLQARTQQFDVVGITPDTIRANLNRDRQHSGSHVTWNFNWESTPGQCRIVTASTEVTVTAHMPRTCRAYSPTQSARPAFNSSGTAMCLRCRRIRKSMWI